MRRIRLSLAAAVPLLAACAGAAPSASPSPAAAGFPATCAPGEVQVMLLGTYHFANPGQDGVKQDVDDVLVPRRQAELADLAARLERFRPDLVAVEAEAGEQAELDRTYERYRAGTLPPTRNETVQIGMRLASRLGHARLAAIDFPMRMWNDSIDALWNRRAEFRARGDSITAVAQRLSDAEAPLVRQRGIVENLRRANSPPALGQSEGWQWEIFLPVHEGTNYGGAQAIGRWWERNVRMIQNLYVSLAPGTRRVLVLVGSGHVVPLRELMDASPQFCPVSPLPYLR